MPCVSEWKGHIAPNFDAPARFNQLGVNLDCPIAMNVAIQRASDIMVNIDDRTSLDFGQEF
ncbi:MULTISPECIES: hypothetical protein [unclassified Microcoleus]|uniref:hypothetical protein n=1 Tax=unclassified Microcoleus TaxID=2642155 RepID=UPI002FD74CBC